MLRACPRPSLSGGDRRGHRADHPAQLLVARAVDVGGSTGLARRLLDAAAGAVPPHERGRLAGRKRRRDGGTGRDRAPQLPGRQRHQRRRVRARELRLERPGRLRVGGLRGDVVARCRSAPVYAADLHADAATAFDRYARLTEARMDKEMSGTLPFLWIDQLPDERRGQAQAKLRRGEIVVSRLQTRDGDGAVRFHDAMLSPLGRHGPGPRRPAGRRRHADAGLRQVSGRVSPDRAALEDALAEWRPLRGLAPAVHEEGHQRGPEHRVGRPLHSGLAETDAGPQRQHPHRRSRRRGYASATGAAGRARQRISVALQQLLRARGARRGHARPVRVDFSQPRHSIRIGMAGRTVRHRRSARVAGVHPGGDAQGGSASGIRLEASASGRHAGANACTYAASRLAARTCHGR